MPTPNWTCDDGRSMPLSEMTATQLFAAKCLVWDDDERFDPLQRPGGPGLTEWEWLGVLNEERERRARERFRALSQAHQHTA